MIDDVPHARLEQEAGRESFKQTMSLHVSEVILKAGFAMLTSNFAILLKAESHCFGLRQGEAGSEHFEVEQREDNVCWPERYWNLTQSSPCPP
jgi:hypothetical protein